MTGGGDRPDAAALLRQARRTLLEVLLPDLPEERRYEALMVANALGITLREMDAPRQPDEELLAALAGLPGAPGSAAELVAAIRIGRLDGDAALHALLLSDLKRRLAITNPKALKAFEEGA